MTAPRKSKARIRKNESRTDGADFLLSATSGDTYATEVDAVDVVRFAESDDAPESEILFI